MDLFSEYIRNYAAYEKMLVFYTLYNSVFIKKKNQIFLTYLHPFLSRLQNKKNFLQQKLKSIEYRFHS